jgi:hypothetical protein
MSTFYESSKLASRIFYRVEYWPSNAPTQVRPDGTPITDVLVFTAGRKAKLRVINMNGKTVSRDTFCSLAKAIQGLLDDGYHLNLIQFRGDVGLGWLTRQNPKYVTLDSDVHTNLDNLRYFVHQELLRTIPAVFEYERYEEDEWDEVGERSDEEYERQLATINAIRDLTDRRIEEQIAAAYTAYTADVADEEADVVDEEAVYAFLTDYVDDKD